MSILLPVYNPARDLHGPRSAFGTFLLALGLVSGIIFTKGPSSFTFIYEHWPGIVTAALLNSILSAAYVYWASFKPGKLLALGGNSGNFIYDASYFIFCTSVADIFYSSSLAVN